MSDVVIRAEGLGKKYLIGHQSARERYTALRDVLARGAHELARSAADMLRGRQLVVGDEVEEFWAVRDVSFEVKRGEVVGIIGRNGAGKSTLLKILSRITEPSAGRVTIKGRVASLLEVGTGFHPELTGRENIYLNGAILGMSRAEIRKKFDEIVAFAEVEKFLDTPVKRFSSGMYVRLAFAVAAHLEPEILVVDEVLAVGDIEFQKKCLGKMGEISGKGGRTVLFVSHNMGAVAALCSRGMLLTYGQVTKIGSAREAIAGYASMGATVDHFERKPQPRASASVVAGTAKFRNGGASGSWVEIALTVLACHALRASVDVRFKDGMGSPVAFGSIGAFRPMDVVSLSRGDNKLRLEVPAEQLAQGNYSISIDLAAPNVEYFDRVEDCLRFTVASAGGEGDHRALLQSWGIGSIHLPLRLAQSERG